MKVDTLEKELEAVKTIINALIDLDDEARGFVLKTVSARIGISISLNPTAEVHQHSPQTSTTVRKPALQLGSSSTANEQTPEAFLTGKKPRSEVQRVACLAFYLTDFKGQKQFKTKDLVQLNSDAGQARMSNASTTVANAEKSGYITLVGKGLKQITTFGKDIVNALPDEEAVKTLMARRRKPRRRKAKNAPAE
jgi:hypothetical protein